MGTSKSKPDSPPQRPFVPPWADQDPAPPPPAPDANPAPGAPPLDGQAQPPRQHRHNRRNRSLLSSLPEPDMQAFARASGASRPLAIDVRRAPL
jgi:hypothetical protein